MSTKSRKQRALVVVGAGASVDFGIPITSKFGKLIDATIKADPVCVSEGGTDVYLDVQAKLRSYYGNDDEAHFERVYHVMRELSQLRVTPGAVPTFKPVMYPFIEPKHPYADRALTVACETMLDFIYAKVSDLCGTPAVSLTPLSDFFETLETRYIPRVYTTNYDDFVSQATHGRYFTGFTTPHGDHRDFDAAAFWSEWDRPSLFHVHGSVHMGFPLPLDHHIGDLAWYDDRAEALQHAKHRGSGRPRMDGTQLEPCAIVTGLDKLGRLQQSPFASYYAGCSRDAMEADLIIMLGSGLADRHLNTFLTLARRARPDVPILYVGFWGSAPDDFYSATHSEFYDRDIALFHELAIDVANLRESAVRAVDGWTRAATGKAAVWADGFLSCLKAPNAFARILAELAA